MNVFTNHEKAGAYDAYYQTSAEKEIDAIEEKLIAHAFRKEPTLVMIFYNALLVKIK